MLEKKLGVLRDGMPFVEWDLPTPIKRVEDRILKQPKENRAFIELLMLAEETGLDSSTFACELTLECGAASAPVVTNESHRLKAPHLPMAAMTVSDGIALNGKLVANCPRSTASRTSSFRKRCRGKYSRFP
jgi:hypothetical protein